MMFNASRASFSEGEQLTPIMKYGRDLFQLLVLCFGQEEVGECPEEGEKEGKQEEGPLFGDIFEQRRKALTDGHIGRPIDQDGQADGCRARTLREQLGYDHPGYGAGSDGKEKYVAHHRHDAQVLEPLVAALQDERDGHQDAKDEHAAQAKQVQEATTAFLHQRYGNERHYDHDEADEWRSILAVFDAALLQYVV